MGSLQVKNNIYQAVMYDTNGKQHWRSTRIIAETGNEKTNKKNKREAEKRLAELSAQYEKEPYMFNNVLFVDYIRKWFETVKNNVDVITYNGYKQCIERHIIPYFEPLRLKLKDVRLKNIEDYYSYKAESGRLDGKEGGLSRNSIAKHSVILNLVFEYAMRNEDVNKNPCMLARIPKTAKKKKREPVVYTPEECETLLKCTEGTILHDMIKITYLLGLRREELMGLKWSAVDFDNNILKICHTVVLTTDGQVVAKDATKTEDSHREYPLFDDIRDILLSIKAQQEENRKFLGDCYIENDYVFVKDDGSTYYPDYPSKRLSKVLEKYNLPHIRWHDLRHSCATMLLSMGWSMKDVSEWLGHSGIVITMDIYAHTTIEHKRKIGDTLNGILTLEKHFS